MGNFRYRCSPYAKWVADIQGIVLINSGTFEVHRIGYPQAAVWDLISRDYHEKEVITMLSFIADMDIAAANNLLHASLKNWAELGLIIKEDENG